MTRNAWAFRVDSRRWIPLPGTGALVGTQRDAWIERATVVLGTGNVGQYASVEELRQRCAAIADAPRGPESVVFVPVMEPFPVLVHMTTDGRDATSATRQGWLTGAATTRSIEETPLNGAALDDASRIARVDVDREGHVTYSVAFVGQSGDLGTVWHGITDQPLVAGQLMSMGAEVFATVRRR